MQILRSKKAAILIAILLTVSMSASTMLIPTTSAHVPAYSIPTFAYVTALPQPIGVGQTTLIYMWLNQVFGAGFDVAGQPISSASLANNYRFHNFQLTITAPDGTNTSKTFRFPRTSIRTIPRSIQPQFSTS